MTKSNQNKLHQGSTLTPYFALVMDQLTRHIHNDIAWCKLCMVDAILVAETKFRVYSKFKLWMSVLESKNFRLSRTNMEYMECSLVNLEIEIEVV